MIYVIKYHDTKIKWKHVSCLTKTNCVGETNKNKINSRVNLTDTL